MKLIDKAREVSIPLRERMGWCEFVEKLDDQRDGIIYFCEHEKAKCRLMSGTDEPCTTEDEKVCPFM